MPKILRARPAADAAEEKSIRKLVGARHVGEHIEVLCVGAFRGKWEMAGISVSGVDSPGMIGFLPVAGSLRSHRVIDVSSGHRMFLRYAPEVAAAFPDSGRDHDAFDDIHGCIAELKQQTRAGSLLSEGFARTQH